MRWFARICSSAAGPSGTWFAEQNIPSGHHGNPEDIANLMAFLPSDKVKFMTGQSIDVDGGIVMGIIRAYPAKKGFLFCTKQQDGFILKRETV